MALLCGYLEIGECAQSIICIRDLHNPLGLKWKQRKAVFSSLSRRHLPNSTRVRTQWEIKTLFNDESLVVEEDFLILWPMLYNHLVKADEICNCAEISLGRGPRCLLLCRQKEFSCECFP